MSNTLESPISSIMTKRVVTVEMDDSLEAIREIFKNVKFHHVIVVSQKQIVGVISDRDLLKQISPFFNTLSEQQRDRSHFNKRAHQIMTRKPILVHGDESIRNAAKLMVDHSVSCLPIVDATGGVQGIVTWKDILRMLVTGRSML